MLVFQEIYRIFGFVGRPGDEKSGQIFFYTMVISDGFLVPIQSMLSEQNDANWITYFMSEWVRETSEIPNQFTSDMSMALLNGAVKSFASCGSVADYVRQLFDLLCNVTTNAPTPKCFVRIDVAHFMKNLTSCDLLKNSPKKVRDFYIRSVAYMMKIVNFDEARQHIRSILIVARSKTEGT